MSAHDTDVHLPSGIPLNCEEGFLLGLDPADGAFAGDFPATDDVSNMGDVSVRAETIEFSNARYLIFLHVSLASSVDLPLEERRSAQRAGELCSHIISARRCQNQELSTLNIGALQSIMESCSSASTD
jgi:hypothetical protein